MIVCAISPDAAAILRLYEAGICAPVVHGVIYRMRSMKTTGLEEVSSDVPAPIFVDYFWFANNI